MLQILKDIAGNRMPSVADLLKQASQSPTAAASPQRDKTPMAGMVRDTRSAPQASEPDDAKKAQTGVPQVVDRESSQQPLPKDDGQQPASKSSGQPRLTLPVTTVAGKAPKGNAVLPDRAEGRGGRHQAARPARRVREDRRRAQPRAGQPGREHAGQAAEGRVADAVQHRRPDRSTRSAMPSACPRPRAATRRRRCSTSWPSRRRREARTSP